MPGEVAVQRPGIAGEKTGDRAHVAAFRRRGPARVQLGAGDPAGDVHGCSVAVPEKGERGMSQGKGRIEGEGLREVTLAVGAGSVG